MNEFRDHLRKRYGGSGALWTGWGSTTLFEPHVADSIFHTMAAAEPTLEVVLTQPVHSAPIPP